MDIFEALYEIIKAKIMKYFFSLKNSFEPDLNQRPKDICQI